MKQLLLLALAAVTLVGCKSATRLSIRPEEAHYRFTVRHSQPQQAAFTSIELALAEAYNDLPRVLKLKQPETGTYLLKPLVRYQVGGALGAVQHARYTLKIVVLEGSVTLDFEIGPEETYGTWAPETEIPKIRSDFQAIAAQVAKSVNGTLE
jgi:hypothetical protein